MGAKQGTTITDASARALGARGQETLSGLYASSPLYNSTPDQLNDDGSLSCAMRVWYDENVLNIDQNQNTLFGEVSMDYGTAPDIATVEGSGEGGPAGPYVPNPTSPGEGNGANPAAQPAAPSGYADGLASSGMGSTEGPSQTSPGQGSFALSNLPTPGTSAGTG